MIKNNVYPSQDDSQSSILIVDDAPKNLRLLSDMLNQFGYIVRSTTSGEMALIAVNHAPPDIILLDIDMPSLDGFEVCKQLKNQPETCNIPIIFLTAYDDLENRIQAFQVGGQDYITKPFYIEEVIARVKIHLTISRNQSKLQQARDEATLALQKQQELYQLKEEFTAMIYHDFKSPLSVIKTCVDLLLHSGHNLSHELQRELIKKIESPICVMSHLIDNLLLNSGSDNNTLQPYYSSIDMVKFCQELIETIKLYPQFCHVIEADIQIQPAQIRMDVDLLRQILINLLSNAIKYSPAHSMIQFIATCVDQTLQFQVIDQGIGIPQADYEQIYTPFYRGQQAAEMAQGSGLGLATVAKCLNALNGKMSIDSNNHNLDVHHGNCHDERNNYCNNRCGTKITVWIPLID